MNKKILITIGILVIAIILIGGCIRQPLVLTEEQLTQKFSEFKIQYNEKKAQGYNVTEAEEFVRKAWRAFERKDYKAADEFLDNAFEALERAKIPLTPLLKPTDLSQVKVASHYRYVTDGKLINRSVDDVITLFKETKTDFIFLGWLTQQSCPDTCSELPSDEERRKCVLKGYSYEHLENAIAKIKDAIPNIIFGGGAQSEFLFTDDVSCESEVECIDKAWEMAFDPSKWGIPVSKREAQCYWARRWDVIQEGEICPPEEELKWKMAHQGYYKAYFPDITNPHFQKILLNRVYKQIDSGVDAIWIDMLYMQPTLLKEIPEVDETHPAVQESYDAIWDIVDKIHEYGLDTKGKYIPVITWVVTPRDDKVITLVPPEKCNVDAAMTTPLPNEIRNEITGIIGEFDEKLWNDAVDIIEDRYKIPIFARIDYGGTGRSSLGVFSQELSIKEAEEFLRKADEFFSEKGIIFIYHIHGGDMGSGQLEKLSYGKYNWYDSLAPEFQTYETIKELALKKAGVECSNSICESGESGYNCPEDCCVSGDGICREGCTSENDDDCEIADLSKVKVASLYERVTDGGVVNRSTGDVISILNETKTDFVFRGFWKWKRPCFEEEEESGYSYSQLRKAIDEIKEEMPDVIFCGSIGLQYLHEKDIDPLTGKPPDVEKLKKMVFDPSKHGLDITLDQLRDILYDRSAGEIEYIPDLTSPEFQRYILDLTKKQIDSGVDAIWLDGPYGVLTILIDEGVLSSNDPLVNEYMISLSEIAEQIRSYGLSKYNKSIYVGSWGHFPMIHNRPFPDLDFFTFTLSSDEVLNKNINKEKWNTVREKAGDVPIFVFFDWSMRDDTPLAIFSQSLTPDEQREFLKAADEFFQEKGINFIYPVHGGFMGKGATRLSYGKWKIYDSLAPEFRTYETIKELAQNKSKIGSWSLTESNSWIRDIPTLQDFVPLGVVHMETEDHILKNIPGKNWGLQCFIFVGEGKTEDGKHTLIFQERVPIVGGMQHRISLDGQWHLLPATRAPMYFDNEKRDFPYPTVYTLGETRTYLSYDEQGRRWISRVEVPRKGIILEIEGKARGIPFWMGKPEGPYIIHGATWNKKDVDTWGGFWDVGIFEANLTIPNKSYTFHGNFLFDRAYHRTYYLPGGAALADFTCMHIHNKDFDLMLSHSINPSPIQTPVPFQHQARLNFPSREEYFTFDEFEYSDNGGLQPSEFHISGIYEAGEVNLTGKAYGFWPEKWKIGIGAWWDKDGKHTWGRAFIKWNGTITLHGEIIEVDDALGIGEFTRFKSGS